MSEAAVSDDALLAGMAVGDEGAGVTFVRRYQRRVYGLALNMVGDQALAQDISQEAFLRAWLHAAVFDRRRGSVTTWLLTITRNLAIDSLRLRRAAATDPSDHLWLNLAVVARLPDEQAGASDVRSKLAEALAALPADQRRVLVLAAVYGYTAEEVSRRESLPLGTVKSRVRRGLQKLRAAAQLQQLSVDGGDGPTINESGETMHDSGHSGDSGELGGTVLP